MDTFNIEYNRLKSIKNIDLFGLTNLKIIKAGGNNFLKNIEPYAFQSLINVEIVSLDKNGFETFDSNVFIKMAKLKNLSFNFSI